VCVCVYVCVRVCVCVCVCVCAFVTNKTVDFTACDAAEFAGAAGVRLPCTTANSMHVFQHVCVCVHLFQVKSRRR